MTAKEMIELVQQHHEDIGEVEAIKLLNRAKDDFCAKTEIIKTKYTTVSDGESTTTSGRRYYSLSKYILKIRDVWLNDVRISRIIGEPIIDDDTSEDD
tara:strand:+ start:2670 stop:2963 length:294 start_codon:yes stop_codon:yes gene_type:complete